MLISYHPGDASEACDETEFECGSSGLCLPIEWRCNGQAECPAQEDEMNCTREQPWKDTMILILLKLLLNDILTIICTEIAFSFRPSPSLWSEWCLFKWKQYMPIYRGAKVRFLYNIINSLLPPSRVHTLRCVTNMGACFTSPLSRLMPLSGAAY